MSRWALIPVILVVLLMPLAFAAACEDACNADYGKWSGIDQAKYDTKSYYCGVTETNCWSREGLPSGSPDPCWKMCYETPFDNDGFQACCLESAKMNADRSLAQCLANCGPSTPPQQPSQPPVSNASNATTVYNVEISSSGSITITDLNGNPVQKLANTPVSMKTGDDGNLYVVFKTPSGDKAVQLHLEPDSDFRLDATGACPVSGAGLSPASSGTIRLVVPPGLEETWGCFSSEHGSIRGTINGGGDFIKGPGSSVLSFAASRANCLAVPLGSPLEENMECKSSEHSSIRGSINGGGDFIKGPKPIVVSFAAAGSNPADDIVPDAVSLPSGYGRIDVNETTAPGEPGFELKVSLPDGNIFVNPTGGNAAYSAEPFGGGVELDVSSGSIIATSDQLPGTSLTIGEGQTAFLSARDMSGPAISNPLENQSANETQPANGSYNPIAPPVTPPGPSGAACTSSVQCPGTELCQNGTCSEPACLPTSFIIAFAMLGAIFLTPAGDTPSWR